MLEYSPYFLLGLQYHHADLVCDLVRPGMQRVLRPSLRRHNNMPGVIRAIFVGGWAICCVERRVSAGGAGGHQPEVVLSTIHLDNGEEGPTRSLAHTISWQLGGTCCRREAFLQAQPFPIARRRAPRTAVRTSIIRAMAGSGASMLNFRNHSCSRLRITRSGLLQAPRSQSQPALSISHPKVTLNPKVSARITAAVRHCTVTAGTLDQGLQQL